MALSEPQHERLRRSSAGPAARLSIVALAALALACGGEEEAGRGGGPTAVEGAVARQDTLSLTVRAVGSLEADALAEIRPEIDGHVTSIHFREGDRVEEGQVLVRLDENQLRAQTEAARATVARTRAEMQNLSRRVERNDSLLARGAISEQAFDDLRTEHSAAQARLEEAEANLNLAQQRLEDATIRAPFAGRTGARTFDRGDYVQVGEHLFTLVDDQPLEIRFSVPERYLGRLHRGSPVSLQVRSMPGRTVEGQVDFVSPYVDPANRTVELKARVPNPASELRAGQFANVRLQLESRPAVVVPEAAVIPRQEGSAVYLVRGDTVTRRRVETGARRRGIVEILSGVSPGDTVVVAGQQNLQEGAEVALTLQAPGTLPGEAMGAGEANGSGEEAGDASGADRPAGDTPAGEDGAATEAGGGPAPADTAGSAGGEG